MIDSSAESVTQEVARQLESNLSERLDDIKGQLLIVVRTVTRDASVRGTQQMCDVESA